MSRLESRKAYSNRTWTEFFGFYNRGTFRDVDVIAVHRASKPDPTQQGMIGTENIRNSLDACNASLTFTVIYRSSVAVTGYQMLDIECADVPTYFLLLRGFKLTIAEAASRQTLEENVAISEVLKRKWEQVHSLWSDVQGSMSSKSNRSLPSDDPITALFQTPSADIVSQVLSAGTSPTGVLSSTVSAFNERHSPKKVCQSPLKESRSPLPLAQFLGWKSAGTQVWARLKMAGLEVKCVFSWDLKRVLMMIRCPQWRLEEVAEAMHMKLRNR